MSSITNDPVDFRETTIRSRFHTPIVKPPVVELTRSQHSTPTVRRVSSDDCILNNIKVLLIKQGKQIRVLYEMQKTSLEHVSFLNTQIKKLTSEKNNQLSSKIFNVSNNLICIILSHFDT